MYWSEYEWYPHCAIRTYHCPSHATNGDRSDVSSGGVWLARPTSRNDENSRDRTAIESGTSAQRPPITTERSRSIGTSRACDRSSRPTVVGKVSVSRMPIVSAG